MTKRTVAAVLWLLAVWTVGNALGLLAGWPSFVGPALGLVVAALVWWDPAGWLWPRHVQSAAARRRLADLTRVSGSAQAPELRRETDTAHT